MKSRTRGGENMNQQKRGYFWYIGLFACSVALILIDAPLFLKVRRYVSRTYLAYLHTLYLSGVFSLFTVLLLCKSRVSGAVKSKWLSGLCLAVSLLLWAAVWIPLPISPGLPGSNSFSLSAMLVAGCVVDLVDSFRTKK